MRAHFFIVRHLLWFGLKFAVVYFTYQLWKNLAIANSLKSTLYALKSNRPTNPSCLRHFSYVMDVKEEYDIAKDLLYHLRELTRLREAISEMNRSLISEIHRYPTPPPIVHQVMTAVFILLGESPNKMKVRYYLRKI